MNWFWYVLDWFDDKIIGHRFYWLCEFVCKHYPEEVRE